MGFDPGLRFGYAPSHEHDPRQSRSSESGQIFGPGDRRRPAEQSLFAHGSCLARGNGVLAAALDLHGSSGDRGDHPADFRLGPGAGSFSELAARPCEARLGAAWRDRIPVRLAGGPSGRFLPIPWARFATCRRPAACKHPSFIAMSRASCARWSGFSRRSFGCASCLITSCPRSSETIPPALFSASLFSRFPSCSCWDCSCPSSSAASIS